MRIGLVRHFENCVTKKPQCYLRLSVVPTGFEPVTQGFSGNLRDKNFWKKLIYIELQGQIYAKRTKLAIVTVPLL